MVDEDCGDLKYCLYEIENSKCLPCIPTDMVSRGEQLQNSDNPNLLGISRCVVFKSNAVINIRSFLYLRITIYNE